ncbi:MarC family protein [candidate division KSB1 bacterium]|nr:MAG: MarC family protein [candidate division KSB1 bacterium]
MSLLYFIQAFAAVFAITDPFGAAPIFVGLTAQMNRKQQWHAAVRAAIYSFIILAVSGMCGKFILAAFGISLAAFQAAGGLVIVLMGLEMLRGTPTRIQHDEVTESEKPDPIIIPFAMPLVAGPGAITTVITLTAQHKGWGDHFTALIAVAAAMVVLLVVLLSAAWFSSHISKHGLRILLRFLGLILLAIGAQLLLSGVQQFLLPGQG